MEIFERDEERERKFEEKCTGRDWGKNCYDLIVKQLRREVKKGREELKEKYDKKTAHLEAIMIKDIEEKKKQTLPKELEFFRDCFIFNSEKMSKIGEKK